MMKRSFLILVSVLLLICLMLSSCGDESITSDVPNEGLGGDKYTEVEGEVSNEVIDDRKIITTVRYTIETQDFDASTKAIEDTVTAAGGYIGSSQITPGTDTKQGTASYILRVPAEKADGFSAALSGIGHVTNRIISTDDVTLSYTDISSRIATLEAEETRVRALLEQAETLNEILTIDKRLTEISAELTSLKNQLATMENRVEYATFYVTLKDVTEYTIEEEEEGYFTRFGKSFVSSFKIFLDVLGGILIVIVYLLPYLLVAGGIVTLVLVISHRKRKKKENQDNSEQHPPVV